MPGRRRQGGRLVGRLRAQAAVPVLVTGPHSDRLVAALAEVREIGLTEEVPDEPEGGVRVLDDPIPIPTIRMIRGL